MNGAFYIGATGLQAQQRALDIVANNIGNINTTAYKRSSVRFSELVAPTRVNLDRPSQGIDGGAGPNGVAVDAASRIWTQGDLRQTGREYDLAIDGSGFVELLGPAGHILLSRGGALKVNADGYLATAEGMTLKAMISVPLEATALAIGRDGTVSATTAEGSEEIGKLDLVMVKDTANLAAAGDGAYEALDGAEVYSVTPGEDGAGIFQQGALEGSNVQLSDEMVTLLLLQRAFSADAQVVQAGDQLMSIVNSMRR